MSVTIYPRGTTIYKPDKCCNGYTVLSCPIQEEPEVPLITMNGRTIHRWIASSSRVKGQIRRAKLLQNGHMLIVRHTFPTRGNRQVKGGVQEYDWNGNLVWEYIPLNFYPHHDIFRKDNGNTLMMCIEEVPRGYKEKIKDPRRRNITLYSDVILEVTPDRKIVWKWHEYEHLDINRCNQINASRDWVGGPDNDTINDWTHTNTVQALPENRWYDGGDERFKPENVLLSLRALDLVLIVGRDTKKVVWEYTGDYKGGLSGQHEPHMIEKGLPGEGNILIFDNGTSPQKDLAHAGCSFILEVNPVTKKVEWKYERGEKFHSSYTSSSQRLANGNTLINETSGCRIFEVTVEGEIVWEYVCTNKISARAYRYSYDYSTQTKDLGKPEEVPVIPSKDMLTPPIRIATE